MMDINNLITAWKIFEDSNPYQICDGREFRAIREPEYCMGQMIKDTIEILDTQIPEKPIWNNGRAFCGSCGMKLPRKHQLDRKFCSYCGKMIKWE